jgi:quinol monooxygenase YgiN
MPKLALFVRLEAKPGKEADVVKFLETGLALARQERTTPIWFALRLSPSSFGIFDAFHDEAGRKLHLHGPIAQALMAAA